MEQALKRSTASAAVILAASASAALAAPDMKAAATGLLVTGLAGRDRAYIMAHVAPDYIQHNPQVPDGREGLLSFLDVIATLDPPLAVRPVRVLAEGDLVVVQSEYTIGGTPHVIFDLFRFENGLIAEHWDSAQTVPETTASGRSMTDGATLITDPDRTEANKALVTGFVTDVLLGGNIARIDEVIAPGYAQHNPFVPDGREGLKAFIDGLIRDKVPFGYTKIHNVVAEGNFVFTQSEGHFAGKPTAFYDLFRVEDGMIVEHWDAVQEIPETFAHGNGMF